MRRRTARIAGAMIASIMAIGSYVSTPVFAGTTQSELAEETQNRINQDFEGKTLDYRDTSFAVLDTIAEKTNINANDGRSYYKAKVDYQVYFNLYRDDTKTDKHSFSLATLCYRITPSVGKTTDVTEWPFPIIENKYENDDLKQIVQYDIVEELQYFDDSGWYCNNTPNGNTPTITEDAQEGVLTFRAGVDLIGTPSDSIRPLEQYETYTDPNSDEERTYHNMYFKLKNIAGKPGDKLKVEVFHFYNTRVSGSPASLTWIPYEGLRFVDRANMSGGIVISSGYIYIPYNVTYDLNGGTGQTPTAPEGEYFTCDHREVKNVPGQGDMEKNDAKFLGWSATKVDELVTDPSTITDLTEPGQTYTIPEGKSGDVVLYAVWGTPASEAKTSLSKRVLQSGSALLPEMSFTFEFEQLAEYNGVSYVSANECSAPIGNKTITINAQSDTLASDPYVGDLTGKKLYEGKIENVLEGWTAPATPGTYAYRVKEVHPAAPVEGVTYTKSEFIMLVEVGSNGEITPMPSILDKDSQGNTKDQYTTPPAVFDEKHELIFYNNYGTEGGTTPTGIITNNLPFIVIIAGGVGGAVAATVIKAKKRAKR